MKKIILPSISVALLYLLSHSAYANSGNDGNAANITNAVKSPSSFSSKAIQKSSVVSVQPSPVEKKVDVPTTQNVPSPQPKVKPEVQKAISTPTNQPVKPSVKPKQVNKSSKPQMSAPSMVKKAPVPKVTQPRLTNSNQLNPSSAVTGTVPKKPAYDLDRSTEIYTPRSVELEEQVRELEKLRQPGRQQTLLVPSDSISNPNREGSQNLTGMEGVVSSEFDDNERVGNAQELERLKQLDENKAMQLPEQVGEAGGGTVLDSHSPGLDRSNQTGADERVRELYGINKKFSGDSSGYLGQDESRGPDLNRYGTGSAGSAMGAPVDPGYASTDTIISRQSERSETRNTDKVVVDHGDGTRSVEITESYQTSDETWVTESSMTTYKVSSGTVIYSETNRAEYDIHGNEISSRTSFSNNPQSQSRPNLSRPSQDSQPNETTPNNEYGDENPVTGWNSPKGKKDPMDIISQPVHGDEVSSLNTSSPTAKMGTSVVTNPDDYHGSGGGGGGGGRRGKPGEPATDPEEIIPGGPVPPPSGIMSAESLDAQMGLLEAPGVE